MAYLLQKQKEELNKRLLQRDKEIDMIIGKCRELGVNVVLSNVWAEGGKGGTELAEKVVAACDKPYNRPRRNVAGVDNQSAYFPRYKLPVCACYLNSFKLFRRNRLCF